MRKVRVSVRGAGGCDSVERSFHGPISDGVDVDDESFFVSRDAKLIEGLLIEEQFAVASGILVGLGQVCGLRGKFGDAVGKDFDSGNVQVRNVSVRPLLRVHKREFRTRIFSEDLRESDDFRIQLAALIQHFVGLQC